MIEVKVQPHVSSEDGELFDVSLNTDEVSFEILELTFEEIQELCNNIREQAFLLLTAYKEANPNGS